MTATMSSLIFKRGRRAVHPVNGARMITMWSPTASWSAAS